MVLLARPISSCCTRPISTTRAFSTTTAAARSVRNVRPCSPLRVDSTSRAAMALKSSPAPLSNLPPLQLRIPASTRLLTTKREKVKVLAVLYDGGKHAQEVRKKNPIPSLTHNFLHDDVPFCFFASVSFFSPPFSYTPSLPSPRSAISLPYASRASNGGGTTRNWLKRACNGLRLVARCGGRCKGMKEGGEKGQGYF